MLMGRTIESSRCGRPSGLADFKVSTGWLKNFKSRHGIRELQIEGESLSGDNNSAHEFRKRFLQHVEEGYCRDDVYNVDETGVNWKTAKKVIGFKTGVYSHNPNIESYCQDKVGARLVGCCAHLASVLWYLGYWRHNHTQTNTPSLGFADTLQDATTGWFSDDSASENEKET
ncbi:jerky-like protein [Trichonephila clavipes]|nr:jerky-like protein [Trichonephila clavipes]